MTKIGNAIVAKARMANPSQNRVRTIHPPPTNMKMANTISQPTSHTLWNTSSGTVGSASDRLRKNGRYWSAAWGSGCSHRTTT